MLVSLRDVQLGCEFVPDTGTLSIQAQCLFADDSGAQYRFSVQHGGQILASGRCAVIHPQETST